MRILLFFIVVVLMGSCIPQRKLEYLQKSGAIKNFKISRENNNIYKSAEKHVIKANDELLITVSSFDDVSFNYFNGQGSNASMQASNELALTARTYTVDVDGFIYFPVIGKVNLTGLTLDEAMEKMRAILTSYFDQPNVRIKFAFKKISVLGEVNLPGYYTFSKDQITILEAIAMARDLTIHGDRREVLLIRNDENNKALKYEIDLTDDNMVFNYCYYLESGDVIYVKPRKSSRWSVISTPISLIFSTITTALLVYNAIQN